MKKSSFILSTVLLASCFTVSGCDTSKSLKCYAPDGAPSLAIANIISTKKIGDKKVNTKVTTGENASAKCANGEADIAILPTNAAVTIASKRSDYCVFSVNVHGLLYVVGNREIASLEDLKGETVHSIGRANTPEYVFKTILDTEGISYGSSSGVNLEYYTEASSIVPLMLKGQINFAIIGEPAVTNLINKANSQGKEVYRLFDLQQLWQEITGSTNKGYPQASLIIKRKLVEDETFANQLKSTLAGNNEFLANNVSSLNDLMKKNGSSLDVNYTIDILNRCNINFVMAKDMEKDIETYLATFEAMKPYLSSLGDLLYE